MSLDADRARAALDAGEFVPFFQPVVAIRTGRLVGFEVLARWQDPSNGTMLPDAFIPMAERDGWISELTLHMLRGAFRAATALPNPVELAFNIPAQQLHDRMLPRQIADIAAESGFPLHLISLELTETALVQEVEAARDVASELKAMGCKLALDDFGTGYSSLRSLQSLPFDVLKVDRSFVGSMTNSKESRKIVAAVVGLGQSLGITTVAEGIETDEQDEMLLWLGCDQGQGWLYGRAVPPEELAAAFAQPRERIAVWPVADGKSAHGSMSGFETLPAVRLAQLRAVYDGAPVGLAFLDRDMRYVTLNRRLAEMNGPPLAAHLGRTVEEMIPWMYPIVEPYIRRALSGQSVPGVEITKPADGPNAGSTVLLTYEPARDEAGEVIGVSVALADMTAIKRAEESRQEAEEHFRYLLDLNPQIPWILDKTGRALGVSSRWGEVTGRESGSWKDFGWVDALHPDDVEHTLDVLLSAMKSGKPIDVRYRVRPAGGEWTWKRSRGWPRYDANGEILYWYGVLEDVAGAG